MSADCPSSGGVVRVGHASPRPAKQPAVRGGPRAAYCGGETRLCEMVVAGRALGATAPSDSDDYEPAALRKLCRRLPRVQRQVSASGPNQ